MRKGAGRAGISRGALAVLAVPILLWRAAGGAVNPQYSADTLPPPDYDSFRPPAVGESYTDPVFGTKITRVTESGRGVTWLHNCEQNSFNLDGSWLLAEVNDKHVILDGETGALIKDLSLSGDEPDSVSDFFWSGESKYHAYAVAGNELRLYDMRDLSHDVIRKFTEYAEIMRPTDGGDLTGDGRHMVLADGNFRTFFMYDVIDNIKYAEITAREPMDYAAASESGKYVLMIYDQSTPEVWDREGNFLRKLVDIEGIKPHQDLALDADGNDVSILFSHWSNLHPFNVEHGLTAGDLITVLLSDGKVTKLLDMRSTDYAQIGWGGVDNRRYVYVATETRGDHPQNGWEPYWGEILEVPLDGSQIIRRFCHHRARTPDGSGHLYAFQPEFKINPQGTRMFFHSAFGSDDAVLDTSIYMFAITPRDGNGADGDTDSISGADKIPPVLAWTALEIAGVVDDGRIDSIAVNGVEFPVAAGAFLGRAPIASSPSTITLTGTTATGRRSVRLLQVISGGAP